jgi:hypoxanthine phosphoribosyltransferase
VLEIDGSLRRVAALALKVAREYDPEIVVGVATAGVVPGAVVAAILTASSTR